MNHSPAAGGANFIVVANRLPVDLERLDDGTLKWGHSPGGLVTALEPFLRAQKGAWVGWTGIAEDARREVGIDIGRGKGVRRTTDDSDEKCAGIGRVERGSGLCRLRRHGG